MTIEGLPEQLNKNFFEEQKTSLLENANSGLAQLKAFLDQVVSEPEKLPLYFPRIFYLYYVSDLLLHEINDNKDIYPGSGWFEVLKTEGEEGYVKKVLTNLFKKRYQESPIRHISSFGEKNSAPIWAFLTSHNNPCQSNIENVVNFLGYYRYLYLSQNRFQDRDSLSDEELWKLQTLLAKYLNLILGSLKSFAHEVEGLKNFLGSDVLKLDYLEHMKSSVILQASDIKFTLPPLPKVSKGSEQPRPETPKNTKSPLGRPYRSFLSGIVKIEE